jgi:hypothetical protein
MFTPTAQSALQHWGHDGTGTTTGRNGLHLHNRKMGKKLE